MTTIAVRVEKIIDIATRMPASSAAPLIAAGIREAIEAEREACRLAAATFDAGDPGLHETYADGRRAAAAKIALRNELDER